MKAFTTLVSFLVDGSTTRNEVVRARARTAPTCEGLEDRKLLTAGWTQVGGAGTPPADFHLFGGKNGTPPANLPAPSAAAQSLMKTLQANEKTLQTEIQAQVPQNLFDAVKADAATIQKALGTTGGFDHGHGPGLPGDARGGLGFLPGGPLGAKDSTGTIPPALTAKLTAAGITQTQLDQFQADSQALNTATQAVDPSLQATIQSEQQQLRQQMPRPPAGSFGPGVHFDHIRAEPTGASATASTPASTA